MINHKKVTTYQFLVQRVITPCTQFAALAARADSMVGGKSNVTFDIFFETGHHVPRNGLLSVWFPDNPPLY